MADVVKLVEHDAAGNICRIIETSSDNPLLGRLQEAERLLAERDLGPAVLALQAELARVQQAAVAAVKEVVNVVLLEEKAIRASSEAYDRGFRAGQQHLLESLRAPRPESRHARALRDERAYREAMSRALRNAP